MENRIDFIYNKEKKTQLTKRVILLGTLLNAAVIVVASLLGSMVQKRIPARISAAVMQVLGLVLTLLAVTWFLKDTLVNTGQGWTTQGEWVVLGSMILGALLGPVLDLAGRVHAWQNKLATTMGSKGVQGFFTATILYTVGAMAILGAFRDGLQGDSSLLVMKSILDGVTSLLLSSTFGLGVAWAALPVLIYQGGLTLLAGALEPLITPAFLTHFSQVGDIILVAIGLQLLQWKQMKPLNWIPALLGPIILALVGVI